MRNYETYTHLLNVDTATEPLRRPDGLMARSGTTEQYVLADWEEKPQGTIHTLRNGVRFEIGGIATTSSEPRPVLVGMPAEVLDGNHNVVYRGLVKHVEDEGTRRVVYV